MKKIIFLLMTLGVFTLTACNKDDDDAPGPGNGNNTRLLKKLTKTENGNVTIYNFQYDANKRLMSVKSTDNSESTEFTYDAAGNLVKVEEREPGFRNIYTYAYVNNLPATGTFKSWEQHSGEPESLIEDDLLTYTVEGGVVSRIKLDMTLGGETAIFALSYTNGNLTRVQTVGVDFYTATFTFGNKKPVFPVVSNYILDHAGFSLQFAAKNEVLSANYDFPGTEMDETITTQYTYDTKGYVLTSTDGTAQLKFDYE